MRFSISFATSDILPNCVNGRNTGLLILCKNLCEKVAKPLYLTPLTLMASALKVEIFTNVPVRASIVIWASSTMDLVIFNLSRLIIYNNILYREPQLILSQPTQYNEDGCYWVSPAFIIDIDACTTAFSTKLLTKVIVFVAPGSSRASKVGY